MSDHVRCGIHPQLEAEANSLIFDSLKGVTSQSAKSDILTPWKEQDRRSREVLAVGGTVDPAIRRGMYHRASNMRQTHLNARDGRTRPQRVKPNPWESTSTVIA
jgi:hypothetical protein